MSIIATSVAIAYRGNKCGTTCRASWRAPPIRRCGRALQAHSPGAQHRVAPVVDEATHRAAGPVHMGCSTAQREAQVWFMAGKRA